MPRYSARVVMRLTIATEVSIQAKDEETATERVNEQIMHGRFGTLAWKVTNDKSRSDWNEGELDVAMDGIEEE